MPRFHICVTADILLYLFSHKANEVWMKAIVQIWNEQNVKNGQLHTENYFLEIMKKVKKLAQKILLLENNNNYYYYYY